MKYLLLYIIVFILSTTAYACPEFDEVDLADGDSALTYEEISSSNLVLTEDEFYSMPEWNKTKKYHSYKNCKDAMLVETLKHKTTGRIFKAIRSYKDACDGGNSFGALYTENMLLRVANISDSFISCYKNNF